MTNQDGMMIDCFLNRSKAAMAKYAPTRHLAAPASVGTSRLKGPCRLLPRLEPPTNCEPPASAGDIAFIKNNKD